MSANPIWIAGYFGPIAGAAPVWIAPGDGTVPSAVQSEIVSYYAPVAGATAVWIAGFFAPPPAAIGATPITISGWGGSGGGGSGGSTSVWSASDAAANGMTLSNGGLTVTPSGADTWQTVRSSASKTSGKLYVEFLTTVSAGVGNIVFGLASAGFVNTSYLGSGNYSVGLSINGGGTFVSTGFTSNYSASASSFPPPANDVWAIAIDFTAGTIWLARNNVWLNSSNPITGSLPIASFTPATVGALFAAMSFNGPSVGVWTLQSAAASQKYAPPSGFVAWDAPVTPPPTTSVWSSSDATANGMTLSNGGLTVSSATITGGWKSIRNTTSHASGKWYFELLCNASNADGNEIYGFGSSSLNVLNYIGGSTYSGGVSWAGNNLSAGFTSNYTTTLPTAANDVWAFAIDFTSGGIWIAQNNVWKNSSNPATGSLPIISFTPATVGALFAAVSFYAAGQVWTLQSAAASQKYAPPSGFSAWDAP